MFPKAPAPIRAAARGEHFGSGQFSDIFLRIARSSSHFGAGPLFLEQRMRATVLVD